MIKKVINKIVFIFLFAILFLSFIKLNTYAVEQLEIDNAIEIPEGGISYIIEEPGDYKILPNDDWNTQIVIKSGSTEENPIRIFVTGDINSYIFDSTGAHPLFSFIQNESKYVEIIGVGNTIPTINEKSLSNVIMYQTTSKAIHLKMENLIINASGGMNIVNVQSNLDRKIFEFNDITFQNWHSTSSGFAVNLTSSTGMLTAELNNCKFINNSGTTGGGFMIAGNSSNTATAVLNNCQFEGNTNGVANKTAGNTAGSINVRQYAKVTIIGGSVTNGSITGTTSSGAIAPGGIAVAARGTCVLEDVQIDNNRGYGIYVAGTLTLKGNTNVTGNDGGNIYLTTGNNVVINENYIGKSGITVQNPPDFNTKRQISTIQSSNFQEIYKNVNITSDNRNYTVRHDGANYLYLWKHEHDWIYSSSGNVIEANCTADPECYYCVNTIKLTLNTEDMIYNGNEYDKASVENNITEVTEEPAGEIYYIGTGTTDYPETTTPPIEKGTYKAKILLGGEFAESNFVISTQKRGITAIIDWEDNNNSYSERPQNVIIELLQNDVVIQEIELNEEKSWKYEFKDLEISDFSNNEYLYTVRQKSSVGGYYLRNIEQTQDTITLINTKYGKVKLNKEDLLTEEKLEGAVFRLERKKTDTEWEIIEEYTTDSSGIIVINNLTYGTYKLKEIKAPEGYNFNLENAEVELEISEANANYELTVTNKAKPVLPATGGGRVQVILLIVAIILLILPNKLEKNSFKKE